MTMRLKVAEGPARTGRSVGLFWRIHWWVDFGVDILIAELLWKRRKSQEKMIERKNEIHRDQQCLIKTSWRDDGYAETPVLPTQLCRHSASATSYSGRFLYPTVLCTSLLHHLSSHPSITTINRFIVVAANAGHLEQRPTLFKNRRRFYANPKIKQKAAIQTRNRRRVTQRESKNC